MSPLTRSARVCALIPHHDCAHWLPGAIETLLRQTRALDAVVVLDDASGEPPLAVARRYPSVTFFRSPVNVGPYRMVQAMIELTDFDAYLFQDADDLSHPDRLATLLEVAVDQAADIVGSHEVQLDITTPEARTREYPLDVNGALAANPSAFALLHPTSLVSREAVLRAGGYPGGLRFSGDVDFLWRSGHTARIVNADRHLYLRRRHAASLTGSAVTGTRSPARRELDGALRERARANARRVGAGEAPDLSPFITAPPVPFQRLAGPELGTPSASRPCGRERSGEAGAVLVVGGPRNGGDVLAWALDMHPSFAAVGDMADFDTMSSAGRCRPVMAGPAVTARALALAERDPETKVVYVERDFNTTVDSLLARPDAHGDFYDGRRAREAATELGKVADLLLAALGPGRVLRVGLARLVEHPFAAMLDVLAFLGEDPSAVTALAFEGLRVSAGERLCSCAGLSPAAARRRLRAVATAVPPPLPVRLRALTSRHLVDGAIVAVISRGDESLVDLGGSRAWHFPGA
ncbi:MAG TPA: glycosyltransferase, partial [Cryptosporangiaceae bacterium]|nr:glycosyltransferase [Cryptosporangiaceae bacterium]